MEGLTEGRIVHYVLPNGQHRPAIIVKLWAPNGGSFPHPVQLQVFMDGGNDGSEYGLVGMAWETSVPYDETGLQVHSWHWIERA